MRNIDDVLGLTNEVQRYQRLLALNNDPTAARVLERLLAEAETRLAGLNPEAVGGYGRSAAPRLHD